MSIALKHRIDWREDAKSLGELNERLRKLCANLDDDLDDIASTALAIGTTGTVVDGVVILSSKNPIVRTTAALPNVATKFLDGNGAFTTIDDADLVLTDVTTNNVTSTKHGFAPKSPGDATKFLNGAATPAYAAVKDSDLSTSDITTNDVSTTKHGFAPKAPNDATKYLDGTGAYSVPAGSAGSGRLIGIQTITATGAGTYTPTAGTGFIVIEMVGGGGGGGGVSSPGGTNAALASGGSGGAYLRKKITANFSGAGYVVGAKGTGGTAGANNGTDGANTTFTETGGGGTVYTAGKGLLGPGSGSTGGNVGFVATVIQGGTATNGDLNVPGGAGSPTFGLSASQNIGGRGGDSAWGRGGTPTAVTAANSSQAGSAASGKGAGGSGASAVGTGTAKAGGDGTDGMIVIWEYSS